MAHVELELAADPTLGYASWQNNVPLVRSLAITNATDENLEGVQVTLSIDPPLADPFVILFDRLAAHETRRVAPIDIKCRHHDLANRTELERATIHTRAVSAERELGSATRDIEVLAYDQWAGSRALPELLAAFCSPNDPVVDQLIGKAGHALSSRGKLLTGYQSGSREAILTQVAAVYATIAAERIAYVNPPASFGNQGQKIRTPERIAAGRVATCLDTALLIASCLEQVGLHPVVLLMKSHAWAGCWLTEHAFPEATTEDVQAVRKRVDSGELITFETTLVTQSPAGSFKSACDRGREHLDKEGEFEFAVDIFTARGRRILPLPSRVEAQAPAVPVATAEPMIEEVPDLPPLDPAITKPDLVVADETPAGRIARWESKLLDLTLRNRLLNFKPTASTVELLIPDAHELEDRLVNGQDFRIEPKPVLMEGADPREEAVHIARTGERPLPELARELLQRGKLLALTDPLKLPARLLEIYSNAQLSEQEGGSNTLFLALGFLKWKDADKGDKDYLAPILLIPATLKRRSVKSGYELARHDDETLVNPTLLELLKVNYHLTVKGLDPLPSDGNGVDVARVWAAFRSAIVNVAGWEVVDKSYLGIFSFTKHLMWRDLHTRLADLKQNRVVARLVDNVETPYPGATIGRDRSLDDTYEPQALFVPKLADSSQLKAIAMADADCDFVLDGPPGTGKSQTITNVIADSLAKGKTVLFVSEKIAALNVVHTRLDEVGLGPFCLELHSAKAKKSEVMKQLGRALDFAGAKSVDDWEREASGLAALRSELNELVRVLHRVHPNGLTVYRASGLSILNANRPPAHFEWTDPNAHDRATLDDLRNVTKRIAALAGELKSLKAHGLEGIVRTTWSPTWEDELFREAAQLEHLAAELEESSSAAAAACGLPLPAPSFAKLVALDTLADVLLRAPRVPPALAAQACDPTTQGTVRKLRGHGEVRRQVWASFAGYRESAAALDGANLAKAWREANATWWPKRWFGKRSVTNTLRAQREDTARPTDAQAEEILTQLGLLNQEDAALKTLAIRAEPLLGEAYQGLKTDWAALGRHEAWCKAFEEASSRFAGADLAAVQAVRSQLSVLVGQHQHLLAPDQVTGVALLRMREAFRNFAVRAKALEEISASGSLTGHVDEAAALPRVRSTIQRWTAGRRQVRTWCQWQWIRSQAIAQGLAGLVAALETGAIAVGEVVDFFEYSYQSWWLKRVIDREPVLLNFASSDHERKIREFRAADARFEKLTEQYIIAKLAERVPNSSVSTGNESEMGKLRRELQRQRGLSPIRQVLSGMPTLLPKLKPCLLMSPLSVAQYLDATHKFDLVVFDEASQIPVWDAVGAIARGKQLLVAGDEMQLPPTSFFQKAYDSEESIAEDDVQDLESVLNECRAVGLPRQRLAWHYRSRHEALIAFSNQTYYDGNLITFPSPVTHDTSVAFRHVPGVYDRGGSKTNRAEADAIVAEIEQHYLDEERRKKSVGVVTFNQPQMALIQQILDARRTANPQLDQILAEIEHEELFIKNLENVQGDERDVILFSITYGPDAGGKVNMTMGPLTKDGGHRRLNVAITRAREQVILVSTLLPEQIDTARASGQGVADLKAYLDYARRGKIALLSQSSPTGLEPDSPFEVAVLRALRAKGWTVHPQVGCSGYRIDIGVVNPDAPGEYLVGVECDGAQYHSAATARDRDRLRQLVLERLGWRLHRIWSTDWWTDHEKEIEKLDAVLKERREARAHGEAEAMEGSPGPGPAPVEDDDHSPYPRGHALDDFYARAPAPAPDDEPVERPGPAVYMPHRLAPVSGRRFDERFNDNVIRDQMLELVSAEGPIEESEVFRRVARAWGIERVGNRIAERLERLCPPAVPITEYGGRFYWPANTKPAAWRGFRIAGAYAESKRHIDDVALDEIANAAAYLLENGGNTPLATLAKEVCRVFGMARITSESVARAMTGVRLLVKRDRAKLDEDQRVSPM